MKTVSVSDITQQEIDAASEIVISGIKAYNRKLDTRKGTVLRDLLVDPESAMEGVVSRQIDELRTATSLKAMNEAEKDGGEIDKDDVSAVLSNFNMSTGVGKRARGIAKIVVSDSSMSYVVPQGMKMTTIDGIEFEASEMVVASSPDLDNPSIKPTTKLYSGAAGLFFLVDVEAVEAGAVGNITQGTALESPGGSISYVSIEAYKDFDGGLDADPLDKTIENIPSSLSIRGFVNKNAVEGMLRDKFDAGNYPIMAVSSVGYGNGAQRRDKHNVFGVGVGGRVDVYVRNFGDLFSITRTVVGTKTSDAEYSLYVSPEQFPGACWVKGVEDMAPAADSETILSSLDFTAKRNSEGVGGTWHDISVSDNPSEAFNSVWQSFDVTLSDVPADIPPNEEGDDWSWSEEREFKVTMYCLPQAKEIQDYVDEDSIRSIASDVVVRCPVICKVTVNATVRYDPANPMDESHAKYKVRSYINGLGFVGRLTRSEIVHVLKSEGAVAVDMPVKDMLYGVMHDAAGNEIRIQGDALDIESVASDSDMLTPDTVIFAAEKEDIQLTMVPNTK